MISEFDQLHIIGGGGFGNEVSHLLRCKYPNIKLTIYDDFLTTSSTEKIAQLTITDNIPKKCVITIGDPIIKKSIYDRICCNKFLSFPNIDFSNDEIYPSSLLNKIGFGNIIMPRSIIGFNSQIGSFNIFGANVGIGHDVVIGDFNFLGPNSFLAGNSKIGDFCKLSFGTFIMQNGFLGSNIKSMPYTAFYKKYKLPGTYFGNPGKLIKF